MAIVNIYSHVFPVVSGPNQIVGGELTTIIKIVSGTAFSIGNNFFLTAAHVIHQTEDEHRWLGYIENQTMMSALVKDVEIIEGLDLAIMYVPGIPSVSTFEWSTKQFSRLDSVFTAGYPFALDLRSMSISARAFSGSIVGFNNFYKLSNNPEVYELSFPCPRGLSGSPLVLLSTRPQIIGFVIGNQSTEMNIFTDREEIIEGTTTIVERYEAMQLGIAVSSSAMIEIESRILGCKVGNYLARLRVPE